jgi:hypothetical protein
LPYDSTLSSFDNQKRLIVTHIPKGLCARFLGRVNFEI